MLLLLHLPTRRGQASSPGAAPAARREHARFDAVFQPVVCSCFRAQSDRRSTGDLGTTGKLVRSPAFGVAQVSDSFCQVHGLPQFVIGRDSHLTGLYEFLERTPPTYSFFVTWDHNSSSKEFQFNPEWLCQKKYKGLALGVLTGPYLLPGDNSIGPLSG